jgi:two-component system, OmpR family, sensor histidine kinase KdpD
LLDLSRIAAHAIPVHVEINAAEELVDSVRQRLVGVLADRELRVLVDAGAPLLLGHFDLAQSVRVLVNLIENALKYSPVRSVVELWVRREGGQLLFTVLDRGSGIPSVEESLIFEPFYRPAGAPSDVGGAGLGLAIARGIAEAQGGSVGYARREGGGSAFTFAVAAAETPALFES